MTWETLPALWNALSLGSAIIFSMKDLSQIILLLMCTGGGTVKGFSWLYTHAGRGQKGFGTTALTHCSVQVNPTWWCHRCAPGKISACAPGCYTQLPRRRRNRLSPWLPCSTSCCGTDVPGIRTPTPVSGGNWEQFCQPCPCFPSASLSRCHVVSPIMCHSPTRI